jgi:hypothetical protein
MNVSVLAKNLLLMDRFSPFYVSFCGKNKMRLMKNATRDAHSPIACFLVRLHRPGKGQWDMTISGISAMPE